ncbi:MAG: GatB/YqeY domain-containing protein [SAR86 cluster bacterium]|uniref:GatB/YqeY domain-containing protein n=1 Tax=SAR86 cluster bacterium TaxID=2030880 RepID=A0A937I6Z6_9GAMM|nr:GatB/YqeY domain-containing protein [SAR86 cluster bacterium]|tara:strand:- start:7967 stop:8416 length:450 start_codon:yes stop_codon:yes gene_type:complete
MSKDLKSLIRTQVTISMKDGDKFKTTVLRMILAEIQKVEIEEKSDLDELQITSILEKMIKQRNDAIAQFEQAKRQELADKEKQEIEIIREFLPEQMSEEEVSELVSKIISEVDAQDMKDMGKVMGSLKPLIAGKADAGVVSQLVKKALS